MQDDIEDTSKTIKTGKEEENRGLGDEQGKGEEDKKFEEVKDGLDQEDQKI
jgi:hypothetical protein